MASIQKRPDGVWRARYRDDAGKEHARHFQRKVDAQRWLDEVTTSVVTGTYVDPKTAKLTVGEWCDLWLVGYGTRRASTVRQATVHVKVIKEHFGTTRLSAVKPSDVKSWTVQLRQTYAPSTTYAIYRRLAQVMGDAVHDGIIPRSPCSRRTAPAQGQQRPYVATTDQVWGLYDAFPAHLRPAVLLGAFVGLRVSEAAALRVSDVDFMRGIVSPEIQYPSEPLKTEISRTPVPIPNELALLLSRNVETFGATTVVTNEIGRATSPWAIERAMRAHRGDVEGLPDGFRFHDLRHYLASLLIGKGLDVKVVQTRLRHGNATTTLNTYGHLWPDADESARSAVADVLAARADSLRTLEA
ncbi:tyrosine-type recombinase/integrase [Ornithinimicrobium ciconiae]|uniref:tyrosine-type recombinase/integrase n=1 Tax=Ornithinimicrobium ciconiae TaxID=2594265 RepID=UPI001D193CF6|nr:site-specific integrase [Ornithinimicrobium ciconiae]